MPPVTFIVKSIKVTGIPAHVLVSGNHAHPLCSFGRGVLLSRLCGLVSIGFLLNRTERHVGQGEQAKRTNEQFPEICAALFALVSVMSIRSLQTTTHKFCPSYILTAAPGSVTVPYQR